MPITLDTRPTPTKFSRSVFEITVDHPYTDPQGVRVPPQIILSRKHQTKGAGEAPSYWTTPAGWDDLTGAQKTALRNALRSIIVDDATTLSLTADAA